MTAVLTDMNTPLGCAVGNSLEVIEAVGVLKGELHGELRDVCIILASEMVSLVYGISADEAEKRVIDVLDSGVAFEKMREWIAASGGDVSYIDNTELFPKSEYVKSVIAPADGYITAMDAEKIGNASVILGAGREKKTDEIDHSAGITIRARTGNFVNKGDVLCTLYTNKKLSLPSAEKLYIEAVSIGDAVPKTSPTVYKIIR